MSDMTTTVLRKTDLSRQRWDFRLDGSDLLLEGYHEDSRQRANQSFTEVARWGLRGGLIRGKELERPKEPGQDVISEAISTLMSKVTYVSPRHAALRAYLRNAR